MKLYDKGMKTAMNTIMNTTSLRTPSRHAHSRTFAAALSALAVLMSVSATPAHAQQNKAKATAKANAPTAELFGVPLRGAKRDALRAAFREGGLQATREEDNYWVDLYDASGVLEGASEFSAGYVHATNEFAFARYTFQGFMDLELVSKVATMVINKYGQPAKREGNTGLGGVKYQWNLAQGIRLEVSRGWPDTTTYLTYTDTKTYAAMKAEQDANQKQADQDKARAQSHAF